MFRKIQSVSKARLSVMDTGGEGSNSFLLMIRKKWHWALWPPHDLQGQFEWGYLSNKHNKTKKKTLIIFYKQNKLYMIGVFEYIYSSHKAKAHVPGQKHNCSAQHTNPGSVSNVPSKCRGQRRRYCDVVRTQETAEVETPPIACFKGELRSI